MLCNLVQPLQLVGILSSEQPAPILVRDDLVRDPAELGVGILGLRFLSHVANLPFFSSRRACRQSKAPTSTMRSIWTEKVHARLESDKPCRRDARTRVVRTRRRSADAGRQDQRGRRSSDGTRGSAE